VSQLVKERREEKERVWEIRGAEQGPHIFILATSSKVLGQVSHSLFRCCPSPKQIANLVLDAAEALSSDDLFFGSAKLAKGGLAILTPKLVRY
jgi:hypothetical protein